MYIGGKLASHPNSITICLAYRPQEWSSDISVLLHMQHTSVFFSLDSLGFSFVPDYSIPGKNIYYAVKYGVETTALRLVCIESAKPCGPRYNADLTDYVRPTFDYYCTNYATIVLPSHTSGNKIVCARQYKPEIGGENSRFCGECECIRKDPRMYYDFGCKILKRAHA